VRCVCAEHAASLSRGASFDALQISPEGHNGALPNQDLLNVPMTLANSLEGVHASLAPTPHNRRRNNQRLHADPPLTGWVRGVADGVADAVTTTAELMSGSPAPGGKEGARRKAAEYVRDLERIAGFMGRCARGTPTGAHASFKTFAVDAVTLRAVRYDGGGGAPAAVHGGVALLRLGVLLEGLTRGSNNLLELLHHSMFYYIMVDDDRFLSIAEYVAPQALMLAALLLTAAALAMHGTAPPAFSSPLPSAPPALVPTPAGVRVSGGGGGESTPPLGPRGGLLQQLLGRFSSSRGRGRKKHQLQRSGSGAGKAKDAAAAAVAADRPVSVHDWSSACVLAAGAYATGGAAGVVCVAAHDAGASAAEVTALVAGATSVGAAVLFAFALGPHGILSSSSTTATSTATSSCVTSARCGASSSRGDDPAPGAPSSGDLGGGSGSKGDAVDDDSCAAGARPTPSFSREPSWASLKVVTLSVASTALGSLTFFNFALALPVTALLVPACLASGPPAATAGRHAAKHAQMRSLVSTSTHAFGRRGRVSAAMATAMAAAGAVLTLAAPSLAATLGALAVGILPRDSMGAFAAHHRAWEGGTFALPLAFGVVWPTAMLCALSTIGALTMGRDVGRGTGADMGTDVVRNQGGLDESKKER